MDVFGECPLKGKKVKVKSGEMAGMTFDVEDWARNVMASGFNWSADMGNPAVIMFWVNRKELIDAAMTDVVEGARIALSGIYGHIGLSGCIMLPEELEEATWEQTSTPT